MKKKKLEIPVFKEALGWTCDSQGIVLVWVDPKQKPDQLLATVIHESVHIYQALVTYIQENVVGNEFQAYTIEYIATTLLSELKKQQESANALHAQRETGLQKGTGVGTL